MNKKMESAVERVLVTREQLSERVAQLGEQITRDYEGKDLIVVCILRGSIIFFSDLIRKIDLPLIVDTLAVSSYGKGSVTSGKVRIIKDMSEDIADKHVLLVEDIIDSGNTMKNLTALLKARGPLSVRICTLLDKPSRREVEIEGDYVGFTIPDEFVVGYGLDYAEQYRNIDEVCVLKESVYK